MINYVKDDAPPFVLGKPRYDQSTFFGRYRHFLDIIDPRTMFTSEAKLQDSLKLLEDFKNGNTANVSNTTLWEAQKIKQAIIHPDTGEKVFLPFRMSGFVPFGSPIVVCLLLPNPTLTSTIVWQWVNQSHNACVNYANRNATKETPLSRFLMGYTGAVTSAISIALGLSHLVKKATTLSPTAKMIVQKFVPFPAVAAASTCNVLLMRNNELSEGIMVYDKDDNLIGSSAIAARQALKDTAITRMILPAPILIIPPICMTFLEKTKLLKRRPKLHLPFNAFITTMAFGLALPVAIAMFPQISEIKTSSLEENIQNLTEEKSLFYNKGL